MIFKKTIFIVLIAFGANTTLLAQEATTIEFRAGALGQLFLYRSGNPSIDHYFYTGGYVSTSASAGAGGVASVLWNVNNFSFSISPALRYSINKINRTHLHPGEEWRISGFVADIHLSAQYNVQSTNCFFKNSAIGGGFSIINIGEPYNDHDEYNVRVISDLGITSFIKYHVSTLQFAGIHLFLEKRFGKLSTKAMLIYSKGSWVQWEPTAMFILNGNLSVQYSIATIKLKN